MELDIWNFMVSGLAANENVSYGVGCHPMALPMDNDELDEAWFSCPDCGSIVYYRDYWYRGEEIFGFCPVCNKEFGKED